MSESKKSSKSRKQKLVLVLVCSFLALIAAGTVLFLLSSGYRAVNTAILAAETDGDLNNFMSGKYSGTAYTEIEKYYPGTERFRFFMTEGVNYFTVSYYDGEAYFSTDTELDECLLISSSCLDRDTLHSFVEENSERILKEVKAGARSPGFMLTTRLTDKYYSSDYYADGYYTYERKASSGRKSMNSKNDTATGSCYFDYEDGGEHYIAATGGTAAKPKEVTGTIETVEEFNQKLSEAGFDLTFASLFGE